ncbi:G/T mismatch-specific thymine DNA glycosylase isoform X1 [Phyllopteryx taeniolatus]|uniref:G/T mismatch-specific thymine DNA glycosylase isoform X1 n=1 Tax=Phyllopteryx taeniolatus TaxID=161469 RepID=UPI002AD3E254|nr:G/T mismatch-specific thymine DNA glycosylase isoform X1 [Phyllopteryx taeniolatus]XP_061630074.1 G/T mismatch-specific thymine DNA glycosylase isoform X1 [Phyllopteryx taeniolatus]
MCLGSKSTVNMEENEFTPLTVPTDYFQQWYQSSQQHPEVQHVMSHHNHYSEGLRDEPVMAELSVHREQPLYQEQFSQNYSHYQEPVYQQQEEQQQQHPAYLQQQQYTVQQQPQYQHTVQQQPQYQHTTQQEELNVRYQPTPATPPHAVTPVKKKRGRPPKNQRDGGGGAVKEEEEDASEAAAKKAKRTLNRFNGMSVAEVMAKTLPDVITYNLDILIIGINPGLLSAYKGHHYPNPGNHFWKCLFLSGFTEQQLNFTHDESLPEKYGIGFTNMVERTTPGSKDLSSKEIREGGRQLLEKLQKYKPLIAAFNGKGIYEIFCKEIFGVKSKNLDFGLQPYKIPDTETVCYLMPSSSPRCAQFPRAQDKVHFYIKLKELRDHMKGSTPSRELLETDYSFDLQQAKEDAKRIAIKEEQMDPEYESCSGQHENVRQSNPGNFY